MKKADITEQTTQMEYAYDILGSRILKRSLKVDNATDGTRYRHCFNGRGKTRLRSQSSMPGLTPMAKLACKCRDYAKEIREKIVTGTTVTNGDIEDLCNCMLDFLGDIQWTTIDDYLKINTCDELAKKILKGK